MHKHGLRPILLLTTRRIFKRHMRGGGRRCIWSFMLESYCLPQFVKLFFICCLRSSFANVDISHSVLFVLFLVLASFDCMSIRHPLLVPGFHRHISCTSLNSSCHPLFQSLCLGDTVFVCALPCLTRQGSFDNRSDSFSTIVVVWFLSLLHAMPALHNSDNLLTACLDVCRQHVESSGFDFWRPSFCQL